MSAPAKKPKSSASRVAAFRKRMREQGLTPRTIWVPDLKDPAVIEEVRRQARAIAAHEASEREALEFIERAFDWPPEETIPDFIDPDSR